VARLRLYRVGSIAEQDLEFLNRARPNAPDSPTKSPKLCGYSWVL
jgi:hypothetical protein